MGETSLPALPDSSLQAPFVHGYHDGSYQALPAEQQPQAQAGTLLPRDVSGYNPSIAWTAGSVISTPDDLVIWVDALVSGRLLAPATQQLRLESIRGLGPDYPAAEGVYSYGFGIDKTGSWYGHGGVITGYNTAMLRDPDTDTTVIGVATLTLAPDGTPVAAGLANTVIDALPDGSTTPSTLDDVPGGLLADD
jgi:D-alanyl-D-alanine carboxypeptidase